ncbi:MAG: TolC family protein, partial [Planctomycetaceae bacterium]|nr:TolC family protein [Planctomycetaceae bacterium]
MIVALRLRRQMGSYFALWGALCAVGPLLAEDEVIIPPQPTFAAPLAPDAAAPLNPVVKPVPAPDDRLYQDLMSVQVSLDDSAPWEAMEIRSCWWDPLIQKPLRAKSQQLPLTLEQVLARTLMHSDQIKVFSELPLIRETSITEADAAFDVHAFLDTRWDDTSDPIGSTLTAGPGITRFRDHHWTNSAGVRKRTITGGQLEVRQDFGFQDNNSQFFVPDPQGTSRIAMSFTQPLMRGRGQIYNESLICLAKIDSKVAHDEFMRQLQSHLLEVSRAYWALYLERGVLYQKLNTYQRAVEIVSWLEKRRAIDASESQIKAAQAALLERRSDLLRAQAAVKNAEARLRALVNDPGFGDFNCVELIPADLPSTQMMS